MTLIFQGYDLCNITVGFVLLSYLQIRAHILVVFILRYVLEETTQHVHVDNRDNTGRSAFMKACETRRREVVDYLLGKGASVNVEDLHHRTPLHVACENGHEDIVKILLDREANLDIQDCYTGAELCFLIRGKDKGEYPSQFQLFILSSRLLPIVELFIP